MSGVEWTVLLSGVAFVLFLGAWHFAWIRLIHRLGAAGRDRNALAVLFTFWGLFFLHLSEVVLGALVIAFALSFPEVGSLQKDYGSTPADLLYLSGVNFSTLGYTEIVASGPVRLLIMLQALSGFMLITWSATLVYSVWGSRYRDAD